jgi:hypothetical protein
MRTRGCRRRGTPDCSTRMSPTLVMRLGLLLRTRPRVVAKSHWVPAALGNAGYHGRVEGTRRVSLRKDSGFVNTGPHSATCLPEISRREESRIGSDLNFRENKENWLSRLSLLASRRTPDRVGRVGLREVFSQRARPASASRRRACLRRRWEPVGRGPARSGAPT